MSAYGASDLARAFRTVRANTLAMAEGFTEEQYAFRPAPGTRTVAETLAHIVVAPRWQQVAHGSGVTSLDFAAFGEATQRMQREEAALTNRAQIVDALKCDGDRFADWLETLSDEVLAQKVGFPPPIQPSEKTRFEMLLSVKEHEMHHRAQLMVVERMLGIVPHLTRQRQAAMQARAEQTPGAAS